MGLFGNVGSAVTSGPKAANMSKKNGDFYMRVDTTKVYEGDKGKFAIVEGTVMHSLTDKEGTWQEGDFVSDMVKHTQETKGMFNSFVKRYVAAYKNIDTNHKFSEDEKENDAEWEKSCIELFGDSDFDPVEKKIVWSVPNPAKGMIVHIKVVDDDQSRKDPSKVVKDDEGNPVIYKNPIMLGGIDEDQLAKIPANIIEKYKDTLSPAYGLA